MPEVKSAPGELPLQTLEGTVERFSQLMPLLGAALVASVIELAVLGFLRKLLLGF